MKEAECNAPPVDSHVNSHGHSIVLAGSLRQDYVIHKVTILKEPNVGLTLGITLESLKQKTEHAIHRHLRNAPDILAVGSMNDDCVAEKAGILIHDILVQPGPLRWMPFILSELKEEISKSLARDSLVLHVARKLPSDSELETMAEMENSSTKQGSTSYANVAEKASAAASLSSAKLITPPAAAKPLPSTVQSRTRARDEEDDGEKGHDDGSNAGAKKSRHLEVDSSQPGEGQQSNDKEAATPAAAKSDDDDDDDAWEMEGLNFCKAKLYCAREENKHLLIKHRKLFKQIESFLDDPMIESEIPNEMAELRKNWAQPMTKIPVPLKESEDLETEWYRWYDGLFYQNEVLRDATQSQDDRIKAFGQVKEQLEQSKLVADDSKKELEELKQQFEALKKRLSECQEKTDAGTKKVSELCKAAVALLLGK